MKCNPQTPQKLLEGNTGAKLLNMGLGSNFLDLTPKAQAMKAKLDKQNHIKIKKNEKEKKLLCSKEKHQQNKKATYLLNGRKYLPAIYLIRS